MTAPARLAFVSPEVGVGNGLAWLRPARLLQANGSLNVCKVCFRAGATLCGGTGDENDPELTSRAARLRRFQVHLGSLDKNTLCGAAVAIHVDVTQA